MKKIIIALGLILVSCTDDNFLNLDNPIIVTSIRQLNNNVCLYTISGNTTRIYAKCGLYQIGDTIKFNNQK